MQVPLVAMVAPMVRGSFVGPGRDGLRRRLQLSDQLFAQFADADTQADRLLRAVQWRTQSIAHLPALAIGRGHGPLTRLGHSE